VVNSTVRGSKKQRTWHRQLMWDSKKKIPWDSRPYLRRKAVTHTIIRYVNLICRIQVQNTGSVEPNSRYIFEQVTVQTDLQEVSKTLVGSTCQKWPNILYFMHLFLLLFRLKFDSPWISDSHASFEYIVETPGPSIYCNDLITSFVVKNMKVSFLHKVRS